MKKFLLLCFLVACSLTTRAFDFIVDGIYYNLVSLDDYTCEVSFRSAADGYNTYSGNVVIPEVVNYYGMLFTVVGIGESAFKFSDTLTEVEIPSSVTYIDNYAFDGCSGLTEVVLPETVNSIGSHAFEECTALQAINIPEGVTSLPDYIFFKCLSLAQITIPESVTTIGNHVLYETPIEEVTIPSRVTTLGMSVFSNCQNLRDVTFEGEGITLINASTFAYCDNLSEITLPNSVTTVENNAFRACSTLKKITFGTSIASIWTRAFYDTTTLEEIYVLNPTPPGIADDTFSNKFDKDQCTLYVPYGCKEVYASTTYWRDFYNIEELEDENDPSGISSISTDGESIVGYYTLGGMRLSAPQKGVNIVKCSDGTTKKILIK